jgi:hypothetical protein
MLEVTTHNENLCRNQVFAQDAENIAKRLRVVMNLLEDRIKILERKEKRCNEMMEDLRKNAEREMNRVVLNVGGTRFETTIEVLMRLPGTYFVAMLGSGYFKVMF